MASVASGAPQSGSTIRAEDVVLARAVDARGIEQLVRNAHDELAHEEHAECAGQERQDQPGVGVHQAQVAHHHEQRHEGHDARHHERPQDHQEQHPLSRELSLASA